MSKTLFAGEYSSRNVGDGIIKLAMEKLCRDSGINGEFKDFFGNAVGGSAFTLARSKSGQNTFKKRLLQSAPVNYAISLLFYFTRYRKIAAGYGIPQYRQVVIGGGNLLMDNFLNFPLLILRIVQQCERHAIPVKLFSVGAGKKHSWAARKIIARIMQSKALTCVICRDPHSYELVKAAAGKRHAHKIKAGFDSGLYLQRTDPGHPGQVVGLGIIAPSILKTLTPGHPMSDPGYAMNWWAGMVASLAAHMPPRQIELISNGSGPDDEFARELWAALEPDYPGLSVCTDIRSPADLMERIGGYRALAAFRMHAAVTAMALDVPVMGFEWDPKVRHLFAYCGKPDSCISIERFRHCSAQDIASALLNETPACLESIRESLKADFLQAVSA